MSKKQIGLGRESALTFAGIVVNAGLAFVITWLIGKGLGAAATGSFFQLTSLFMIAVAVVGLGADTGLVRSLSGQLAVGERAALRPTVRVAVVPVVAVGLLLSAAVWLGAGPITQLLGMGRDAQSTIRILALALLPGTLVGVLLGGSRGLGRIATYTLIQNLFIPITRLVAVAAAVLILRSVWATVWAWSLPLVLAAVLAALALHRHLRAAVSEPGDDADAALDKPETRALARAFWNFSLPRGAAVVLERALDWTDVLLVIALLGPAAGGVYGVVTRIVQAGNMLEAAMRIVMGPRVAAAIARGDRPGASALFNRVTELLILTSWPFYIVVAVFATDLLNLFGSEFVGGAPALATMAAAMAVRNGGGALQTVLLMTGKSTIQMWNKAIQLAILIALSLVFIPTLGILGAAVAYSVGVLADTLIAAWFVNRELEIRSNLRLATKAALLPLAVVLGGSLIVYYATASAGSLARLGGLAVVLAAYGAICLWKLRKDGGRVEAD